jgi:hypothetical protein
MPENEEVILIKPTIDLSAWNSAVSSMLADAARIETKFEGAFGKGAAIDVKVDDSALKTAQRAIDDLDAGVTSEVDFTMSDENTVKKTLDKLDAGTTAEVDFKATGDSNVKQILTDIATKLANLQKLALIKLAMDIPATAEGFITSLTNLPGVSTLIEMDTVLAQVEGRTGRMIPQAEELITELYTNAWGESITAVGNVVTAASNLGIEMDDLRDATMAAFNLEALGVGDAEENLRTLDTMVKNGLAPDFESASNILAAGFQTGANRGQDLLDTFNEYGSTFNQLGISGEAALAFINTGLEAGIDNSDRIADLIRETGIRLGEIHSDPNIQAAFTDLDNLSTIDLSAMLTGWEAGDISGDDMFGAIFQALEDAAAADPTKAKTLASTLMGTIAEDFGLEAVAQLSPVWDESLWGPLEDRAQTASDTVNNTLSTALTELFRTLEVELAGTLDEMFDFDALIDKAKKAIKDIAAALRAGEGLAEALEIGLNIPGFADQVHRIESAINNFLIGLLQAVADIGSFLGRDTSGIRQEVARVGAGQLQFDLEVATTEDEIADAWQRGIDRGVDASVMTQKATEASLKLFNEGDMERLQMLVDTLSQPQNALPGLTDIGRDIVGNTDDLTVALQELYNVQEQYANKTGEVNDIINKAVASDIETVQAAIDRTQGFGEITSAIGTKQDVSNLQDDLAVAAESMKLTADDFGATWAQMGLDSTTTLTTMKETSSTASSGIILDAQNIDWQIGETKDGFSELGSTVEATLPMATEYMTTFLSGLADGSEAAIGFLVAVATQISDMAASVTAIAEASGKIQGLSGGLPPEFASGGRPDPGVFIAGENGPEAIFTNERLAVLNNATTDRLFTALRGGGMGGMTTTTTRTSTVNAPIYVSNFAQGQMAANKIVDAVRGYG